MVNFPNKTLRITFKNDLSHLKELAELIAFEVGYDGLLTLDTTKPDGTSRKLLDVSKINSLGWSSSYDFKKS